jgi:antitoxin component YwqK of YwqJK toxin-antitoxin module
MIEETYDNGIPHGRFASYHPNSKIFSEGNFHNGLREGYFRVYDEEGNNIRNLLFINNIEVESITGLHPTNESKNRRQRTHRS